MTVYVTQEASFDYSPAQVFGEVVFLTMEDVATMKGSLKNEALVDTLRFQLQKFNPDEDYILLSGSPYVSALVFYLLGARRVGTVRMLRWSNRDKVYAPIHINLNRGINHE